MNLHLGINEIVWHSVRSFKFHLHILLISGVVLFVTHFGSALYRDNVGSFQCKYCFNEMIVYEIWKKYIYKKYKAMVKRSLEYEFGWSCDQRFFIFILLFVTYICFWKKKIQNYKHNLALCSFRYRKCDVKYISFCPVLKYTHIWTCLPFCWVIKKMKLEMLLFIFIVKYMWFTVIQMYFLISQMISSF